MDLKEYWNSVAEKMQKRDSNNLLVGYDSVLDRYIRNEFEKVFCQQDIFKSSILEIGSGSGINLEICIKMKAKRIIACDISDKLLNLAKKRLIHNDNCEFHLIEGANLPFENCEIDTSFTVTVLQHISDKENLEKLVSEMCRTTKNKILIFEDVSTNKNSISSEDYVVRNPSFYYEIFRKNGFKIKSSDCINLRYSLKILGTFNSLFLYKKMEGSQSSNIEDFISRQLLKLSSRLDQMKFLNKNFNGLSVFVFEKI